MWCNAANSCCETRPAATTQTGGLSVLPTGPKTRILFVDDELPLLRVLKMAMRTMAGVWDTDFAGSGQEALALLEQKSYDVVVTDMRMPVINGAQLLNHVLRHHPQTIRIVLSGYADLSEVVNCVGLTHQFLEKPCSLDDLKECLRQATTLKARLNSESLRRLATGLKNLPSLPSIYLEITEALQSPTTTAQHIGEIASRDPAISAKLLQLSNSAFFGFNQKVYSVTEAVQLLGVGIIQSLAVAVPIFSAFNRKKCPSFPLEEVWEHSLQTGVIGRRIAQRRLDDSHLADQAFCAGVLHDIGKIILADGLPDAYTAVLKEANATRTPLVEVEQRQLQATHADIGGYLLALWGLPMPLVEAVANHHRPHRCGVPELCLAGVVHVANALEYEVSHPAQLPKPIDTGYLKSVGLAGDFEHWRLEWSGHGTHALTESAC